VLFRSLGESVEAFLGDRQKIHDGIEAVLVDGVLGSGVEPDPLQGSTESDGWGDCGHGWVTS
jgi:hypothetical protein